MDKNIQHLLAKKNGFKKEFIDYEIGKKVGEDFSISEENAQDRKMIKAILDALIKANIEVDLTAIQEFETYNKKVEESKTFIKNEYK